MLRVHNEGLAAKEKGVRGDLRAETDWRSRKFLSERNAYLTGVRAFYDPIVTNSDFKLGSVHALPRTFSKPHVHAHSGPHQMSRKIGSH